MKRKLMVMVLLVVFCLPLFTVGCAHARPPKPGPDFVWVPRHTLPNGVVIRGHWDYRGPENRDRSWVKGHYRPDGTWVPGHWRNHERRPRRDAVWVPGHHGPNGRWIPGHWR